MSMIGNYRRITPEQLRELRSNPNMILDFLYPKDDASIAEELYLYIDKTWHGIHFLLNGQAWSGTLPLWNVVLGGTQLGEIDVGYGPARFLMSDEVEEVAKALMDVSKEDLKARFNPSNFKEIEIYPDIWDEGDEAFEYLLEYFVEIVRFFQEAARCGEAMLLYLN